MEKGFQRPHHHTYPPARTRAPLSLLFLWALVHTPSKTNSSPYLSPLLQSIDHFLKSDVSL